MKKQKKIVRSFIWILGLFLVAFFLALPTKFSWQIGANKIDFDKNQLALPVLGKKYSFDLPLKKGLDIAGGVQLIMQADMSKIEAEDRLEALRAAVEVIRSRIDAYGLAEPIIQTAINGDDYRIIVELPGLTDIDQALSLIGTTAMMDFRLQNEQKAQEIATMSATTEMEQMNQYFYFLESFEETQLQGKMLKKATATFDSQTRQPVIALQFTPEGRELFAQITKENVNRTLGIFIDGWPVTLPKINTAILDGNAIISGNFSVKETQELAIQLNSGALPVPLEIMSQSQVSASLGEDSVQQSIFAGIVGLILVSLFMILNYGKKGLIANFGLLIYTVIILAFYKIFGITLSLPSIAALILSIGMAVDANILIFSRLQEELRLGKTLNQARELSFGRAWDSIRDANVITLMIALILINPLDFPFLNSSGLIRGFGITLFLGVLTGLFTGVFITRNLLRIFIRESDNSPITQIQGEKL